MSLLDSTLRTEYTDKMAPLIRRPNSQVTRTNVETVLRRLMQQPTDIRLKLALRAVDEYAATLHTDRVYAHAEKVVAKALVEAAEAQRQEREFLPKQEIKNLPDVNFCGNCELDEKFFHPGKIFIELFSEKGTKIIPAQSSSPTCQTCAECPNCRIPEVRTPMVCDIAPCTDEPDTNGQPEVDAPVVGTEQQPEVDVTPVGKLCSRCAQVLPYDRFTRNRTRRDGYESACQPCERARKRTRPVA